MGIDIEIYQVVTAGGRVRNVGAKDRIEFSPSEGYDADKLAALERELGPYVEDRLKDALRHVDEKTEE